MLSISHSSGDSDNNNRRDLQQMAQIEQQRNTAGTTDVHIMKFSSVQDGNHDSIAVQKMSVLPL